MKAQPQLALFDRAFRREHVIVQEDHTVRPLLGQPVHDGLGGFALGSTRLPEEDKSGLRQRRGSRENIGGRQGRGLNRLRDRYRRGG